jgi:hypothetical protein
MLGVWHRIAGAGSVFGDGIAIVKATKANRTGPFIVKYLGANPVSYYFGLL